MSPRPAPTVKFTYEDFLRFPNDGKRHEIIDGEHYVTPSPFTQHQVIVGNLHMALGGHLKTNPIGAVFLAPFDVVFTDFDVVEPDLLYISRARSQVLTEKHVRGAPDLVVEVLSKGTRKTDEVTKRKLYERCGVLEYWLADPKAQRIRVHRRAEDAFVMAEELSAERGHVLTTPLLPGLSIPLRDIFAPPF